VTQTISDGGVFQEEDRMWTELRGLIDGLPADQVEKVGYFDEGWSAKDLIGHIGSWLALAGAVLERIGAGTYRPEEIEIDATNERFFDLMHDVAYPDVQAQAVSARTRMLQAWRALSEPSAEADRWISKAGPDHYAEHLPRLKEWVAQLDG
jgi:DinB family protein